MPPRKQPDTDRLPPHSNEAERGVLGCVLISPNTCMGQCIEKISAAHFYDLRHQNLFSVLAEMYDAKTPIDLITLQNRLKEKQQRDDVGGIAYIAGLPDAVPSAANLDYYITILRDNYTSRKIIATCTAAIADAYDNQGDAESLLDKCETAMLKISEDRVVNKTLNIKTLAQGAIDRIEFLHQNQGMVTGLVTGFADLDRMTGGFNGGEMIVIAARPSIGKTSLAMNIAEHVAIEQKLPVGVFSLEMTAQSLVLRMICSRGRVNLRDVRDGRLSELDFSKLTNATAKVSSSMLHIDDSAGLSILQLRAKARRMHQQYGIKLFVIDYLQLLNSTKRSENRQQEIADISNGVKALAKELDVPVIVLAQLNRELEKDKSRKPRLSDLRESGAIEQDADLVGILYKPNGTDEENTDAPSLDVNLLIAKQRNGPTGDVHLTFLKGYTRFENRSRISPEDVG